MSTYLSLLSVERRTRRDISLRRRNLFRRQNSETATRTHSPDVEVMDSVIGQSVVKAPGLVQKHEDQKVLCLDGGGIKVKNKNHDSFWVLKIVVAMRD